MTPAKSRSWFTRFAKATAHASGQPLTFGFAALIVVAWAICGPVFHFSNTWQLVVNTGTTIITFLMVFLIQSTQNRDAQAVQVKLDELLRVTPGAHNVLMDLEELEEADLQRIRAVYIRLAHAARRGVDHGRADQGVPQISDLVQGKTPPKPRN